VPKGLGRLPLRAPLLHAFPSAQHVMWGKEGVRVMRREEEGAALSMTVWRSRCVGIERTACCYASNRATTTDKGALTVVESCAAMLR